MDKPSLAIAIAVKRRAGKKKMAHGGMIENEMLNPEHSGGVGVKNKVLKQFGLDSHDQSHGQLQQPHQIESDFDPKSESAQKYRKYAPSGMYPQTMASEMSEDEAYMADGGEVGDKDKMASAQESMRKAFHYEKGGAIAKAVMKKRMMAQGGYLEPDYAYLEENDSYPDPDEKEHDVLDYDVDAPENKVAKRKKMIKKIFSED